jgi:hypothetical protein
LSIGAAHGEYDYHDNREEEESDRSAGRAEAVGEGSARVGPQAVRQGFGDARQVELAAASSSFDQPGLVAGLFL